MTAKKHTDANKAARGKGVGKSVDKGPERNAGGRPPKGNQRMTVYLSPDVVAKLRAKADERRMNYSALIELYIEQGVARDERRKAIMAREGFNDYGLD